MGLSVGYNQNLNNGIDAAAVKEVTQEIFSRASAKVGSNTAASTNFDFTKFQKPELGLDLYSGNVSTTTAKQVAMANSGMQVNLSQDAIASLNYLNLQASKASLKNLDGKVTPSVEEMAVKEAETVQLPNFSQLVQTTELGSDKKGSNPFFSSKTKSEKEGENDFDMNRSIFSF